MDADGNNQIRLTNHPEVDYQPSWSPDGARIAFVSNRNGGNEQIYVMDSNGKNVKLLTNGILTRIRRGLRTVRRLSTVAMNMKSGLMTMKRRTLKYF